jgi:hypothetical protein
MCETHGTSVWQNFCWACCFDKEPKKATFSVQRSIGVSESVTSVSVANPKALLETSNVYRFPGGRVCTYCKMFSLHGCSMEWEDKKQACFICFFKKAPSSFRLHFPLQKQMENKQESKNTQQETKTIVECISRICQVANRIFSIYVLPQTKYSNRCLENVFLLSVIACNIPVYNYRSVQSMIYDTIFRNLTSNDVVGWCSISKQVRQDSITRINSNWPKLLLCHSSEKELNLVQTTLYWLQDQFRSIMNVHQFTLWSITTHCFDSKVCLAHPSHRKWISEGDDSKLLYELNAYPEAYYFLERKKVKLAVDPTSDRILSDTDKIMPRSVRFLDSLLNIWYDLACIDRVSSDLDSKLNVAVSESKLNVAVSESKLNTAVSAFDSTSKTDSDSVGPPLTAMMAPNSEKLNQDLLNEKKIFLQSLVINGRVIIEKKSGYTKDQLEYFKLFLGYIEVYYLKTFGSVKKSDS